MPDAALSGEICAVLAAGPLHGAGCRKLWARLRRKGVRTSKERVHRLMRETQFSTDTGRTTPRGPRVQAGTIVPEEIDRMRGADITATVTVQHGQVASSWRWINAPPSASASTPRRMAPGTRRSRPCARRSRRASWRSARR